MLTRDLVAFNTAPDSSNKIHDDETARRFGFAGGLVPGVEVHGYLAWGPVQAWGESWLAQGSLVSRYSRPTYDAASVTTTFDPQTGEASVSSSAGVDATGLASNEPHGITPPRLADYDQGMRPSDPPPASPQSLAVGTVLGSVEVDFPDAKAQTYLADVRETAPLYADCAIAHPGWVLGLANELLKSNVTLGPWIHVGSSVYHHAVIRRGAHVSCRGRVAAEYEKSGHRFVDLDVAVFADGEPAASITHVAIYEPRQVREATEIVRRG